MNLLTGSQFKHALNIMGWSQSDFARKMMIHNNTVSGWINGRNPMPMWACQYVALAVTLADFCNEVDESVSIMPAKRRKKPRFRRKNNQLKLELPAAGNGHDGHPTL